MSTIKIKQVKSRIGAPADQKRVLDELLVVDGVTDGLANALVSQFGKGKTPGCHR